MTKKMEGLVVLDTGSCEIVRLSDKNDMYARVKREYLDANLRWEEFSVLEDCVVEYNPSENSHRKAMNEFLQRRQKYMTIVYEGFKPITFTPSKEVEMEVIPADEDVLPSPSNEQGNEPESGGNTDPMDILRDLVEEYK
jgi:hypothetical protein